MLESELNTEGETSLGGISGCTEVVEFGVGHLDLVEAEEVGSVEEDTYAFRTDLRACFLAEVVTEFSSLELEVRCVMHVE